MAWIFFWLKIVPRVTARSFVILPAATQVVTVYFIQVFLLALLAFDDRVPLLGVVGALEEVGHAALQHVDQAVQRGREQAALSGRDGEEAGVAQGWHKYVGDLGKIMSIERFGASAPAGVLAEKFGFTVEAVVAIGKQMAGSSTQKL